MTDVTTRIFVLTPLRPPVKGAYVQTARVQPEFDGEKWNDVLRAQIPADQPALPVHFRIYSTGLLPIIAEYEINLEPGVWTGMVLRPSIARGGYVVEINPLETPTGGEFVEKVIVQPEYNGKVWYDVLRLQTPADQPTLKVQARVYGWKK